MSSTNNLKGTVIKDGRIVYYEKLEKGLYFYVTLKYEPFYDGKNTQYHQDSSQIMIEATISNGERFNYSNGVTCISEAKYTEISDEKGKFKDLEELTTKDGFRVWQQDYNFGETYVLDKPRKTRTVMWLVEVPKEDLLKYCIKDGSTK